MNPGASAMPAMTLHASGRPISSASSSAQGCAKSSDTPSQPAATTKARAKPRIPMEAAFVASGRADTQHTDDPGIAERFRLTFISTNILENGIYPPEPPE